MRGKNYKNQKACENCIHVFKKTDYDSETELFCHIDNSDRPLCGSVGMNEFVKFSTEGMSIAEELKKEESDYKHIRDEWEIWAEQREVHQHGICDDWEGS